ncbi:MAG: hypothetical protein P8J87_09285 [Verrucomicrobiales bacterium]|nr:hypothetical protein [Verrucomicrobiales bacterium]
MVCIAPRLPTVQFGQHQTHRYDSAWIEQTIARAAADAGHTKWVFANDIARGVIEYLSEKFPSPNISLSELGNKISSTLETIGFPDIAALLEMAPPPLEISLAAIARQCGPAFELLYFQELDNQIHKALEDGVDKIRFTGLHHSLELIAPTTKKQRREQHAELKAEIVIFLRSRLSASTGVSLAIK